LEPAAQDVDAAEAVHWNFAAFQIGTVTARDSVRSVLTMTGRVAAPTILYLALLEVVFGAYDWRPLTLHANWIDPELNRRFSFWFVELYVQMMLILAIVLAFRPVRRLLRARPWECSVGFLALSTAVLAGSEALWSFDHLLRRVPHLLMWVFAGGIAACYADTVRRKALVTAMMLVAITIYAGALTPLWFFTWTMMGLIWIERIEIPRWSRRPLYAVAGASLFIYLTNLQFYAAGRHLSADAHFLHFGIAMLGGIAVWKLHDAVVSRLEGWWARRRSAVRMKDMT
jgi:hypothetical protein